MIPNKYSKYVSLQELARGYCLCIDNAIRLIEDAEILINNNRFVGAINYLLLAREEMVKARLINQAILLDENDTKKWKWFWKSFYSHKEKQRILEYEFHYPYYQNKRQFHKRVQNMMDKRESSIYVDFNPDNKKFVSPEETLAIGKGEDKFAKLLLNYSLGLLEMFCIAGRAEPEVIFEVFTSQRNRFKKNQTSK